MGWRGDSRRHYLAAKGIKTKILPHKYMAEFDALSSQDPSGPNDLAKGNRSSPGLHSAHSRGFSKDDLRRSPETRQEFGVSLEELEAKRSRRLPVSVTERFERAAAVEPLPEPISSVAPVESFQQEFSSPVEVPGRVVVTPGTPSRESSFDVGGPPQ